MTLEPIMQEIEAAIDAQLQLAGAEVADAAEGFLTAFRPAVREGLVTAVEQAAAEVGAQLGDRRVDVRLVDGQPELVVDDVPGESGADDEEFEARLTLRLPQQLKELVEEATTGTGESLNRWVVDAVRSRTSRGGVGTHVTEQVEL